MSIPPSGWAPPQAPAAPPTSDRPVGLGGGFVAGTPLGGVQPVPVEVQHPSQRRELILTAILLVAAITTGAASLLSWRDYGLLLRSGATETGWALPDGSMGRGWIAVLLGVVLAVAGVLLAADKVRAGRILATLGGLGLILFSVLEWGMGAGRLRTGPGLGIWVLLVVGIVVVVAVGALGPPNPQSEASR